METCGCKIRDNGTGFDAESAQSAKPLDWHGSDEKRAAALVGGTDRIMASRGKGANSE